MQTVKNIMSAEPETVTVPVRSLLLIWERKTNPPANYKFTAYESQSLGSLMGFVFKFVLGYKDQKERCTVKQYGVGTATKYLNGAPVEFE